MTSGICFKFVVSYHAVIVLLVLEDSCRCVRLRWQSAKTVLPSCAGSLAHLSPDYQGQLRKDYNFGTATSYHGLKWSCIEIVQCKKVKLRSCTNAPAFPSHSSCVFLREDLAFLIADLTLNCQWHLLQFRCELPCSDGSACLGSNRCGLANCTAAAVRG